MVETLQRMYFPLWPMARGNILRVERNQIPNPSVCGENLSVEEDVGLGNILVGGRVGCHWGSQGEE